MNKMSIIIASNKDIEKTLEGLKKRIKNRDIVYINNKKELTLDNIKKNNPEYIFFPHWSYRVPLEIYETYDCVIFHMADVPFGRGGSPLQNQVARGIYDTKLSALKCIEEYDAGPVYLKMPFQLYGTADEILIRAYRTIEDMILYIVDNKPEPIPQVGEITTFKRRNPKDSSVSELKKLEEVYDYIRMLDGEGYPPAYLEHNKIRIEFSRVSMKKGYLIADAIITMRDKDE